MHSVLEVLNRTTNWFAEKGLTQPRLQAEWLLSAALHCKRLDLYLRFEEPLLDPTLTQLRNWVRRRVSGEPLQYITGWTDFYGFRIKTDSRALIPRPETEELAELVSTTLRESPPSSILDLGTGSGAIAVALSHIFTEADILAVDNSHDALQLAAENVKASNLTERIRLLESNWFANVKGEFDLIISNPPYLTKCEWESAEKNVRDYEPETALVAGNEGLAELESILRKSINYLSSGGLLALETGVHHHPSLREIADSIGFEAHQGHQDTSGRDRFYFAKRTG